MEREVNPLCACARVHYLLHSIHMSLDKETADDICSAHLKEPIKLRLQTLLSCGQGQAAGPIPSSNSSRRMH